MAIVIAVGDTFFYADGYISNPKDNSIQLYRNKSDLDYIPPIKIKDDMLSDFGKGILKIDRYLKYSFA